MAVVGLSCQWSEHRQLKPEALGSSGDTAKPGLWTLDWTVDWTRDDHFQFSVRRLEWSPMQVTVSI